LNDLEALIASGAKAAQENVSQLPGAEHDTATPESAKGDYPLEPDPVADATDAKVEPSDGDVVQPAVVAGEPEETEAGEASSEQPAEVEMVSTTEEGGAGKQANDLLASIQRAAEKLAQEGPTSSESAPPADSKKSPDGAASSDKAPGATPDNEQDATAASAPSEEKMAETIELTNDLLSKIGALIMDDEAGQKLAIELINRKGGEKAGAEALQVLGALHSQLEQQAIEKMASDDADAMINVLSKEAAEYGMDLDTYIATLEAGRQKLAAAQTQDGARKVTAARQKIAQELAELAAPPPAAPGGGEEAAMAEAILGTGGEGGIPAEPELSEEDAMMIALQEMIESGELTEEDLAMLAAEAGEAPAAEAAPEGEEALAAMAMGEEPAEEGGEAPEAAEEEDPVAPAAAADAAEAVIPDEEEGEDKEASEADKLLGRILSNLKKSK
jgi:hypothetical protein